MTTLGITGYSDRISVQPGQTIQFYVHSERSESYRADIVRLIHGDTNPDGPGYKEESNYHLWRISGAAIKPFMPARIFVCHTMHDSISAALP